MAVGGFDMGLDLGREDGGRRNNAVNRDRGRDEEISREERSNMVQQARVGKRNRKKGHYHGQP